MAYSGLGTGTELDPYQITTIAQWKEAGSTVYTDNFFLLMNDLDFALATPNRNTNICDMWGVLDGGNHALLNCRAAYNNYLNFNSNSTIKNLQIIIEENINTSSSGYLKTSSGVIVTNFNLENVKIIFKPVMNWFGVIYGTTLDTSCTIKNCTFEGSFQGFTTSTFSGLFEYNKINFRSKTSTLFALFNTLTATAVIRKNRINVPCINSARLVISQNTLPSYAVVEENLINIGCQIATYNPFSLLPSSTNSRGWVIKNNKIVVNYGYSPQSSSNYGIASYLGALCTNNFFSGNVNRPTQTSKTPLALEGEAMQNNFYRLSKFTSLNTPTTGQIGLSDAECLDMSKLTGFDFDTVWQLGEEEPELRNVPDANFFFPIENIIATATRLSKTSFRLDLSPSNRLLPFKVRIFKDGEFLLEVNSTLSIDVTVDEEDALYSFDLYNGSEDILNSDSYFHYCRDIIFETPPSVSSPWNTIINDGVNTAFSPIGRIIKIGDVCYSISSSSESYASRICKFNINDPDVFQIVPVFSTEANGNVFLQDLVMCGGYLWAFSFIRLSYGFLYRFDPETLEYYCWRIQNQNHGFGRMGVDDTHVYIVINDNGSGGTKILRLLGSEPTPATKYVLTPPTTIENLPISFFPSGASQISAIFVEDTYIFIACGSNNTGQLGVIKYNKITKTQVWFALSSEIVSTSNFYLNGGAAANDKFVFLQWNDGTIFVFDKDLGTEVGKIKLLTPSVVPTRNLMCFDNYLFVFGSSLYILDASNADTWTTESNIGEFTRYHFNLRDILNNSVSWNYPQPFFNLESNIFIGLPSRYPGTIMKWTLPNVVISRAPTVETTSSLPVASNSVTFKGKVIDNGMVDPSEYFFKYGESQSLDSYSSVVATLNEDGYFYATIIGHPLGTIYFKAAATNIKGTGEGSVISGEVKHFDPASEPIFPEPPLGVSFVTMIWDTPISLGGGTLLGYKIEQNKSSVGIWETIVEIYTEGTTFNQLLTEKTTFRVSAVTFESGAGQHSEEVEVTPVVGVSGYKVYLGSTEIVI